MKLDLKELFQRAENWSEARQQMLARIMSEIDAGEHDFYQATEDELRAIDEGIAAVERGEIATDEEVAALFAKYR
jgi:hypothetical protein